MTTRFLTKECECGRLVEVPIRERQGDLALDRIKRLEKLFSPLWDTHSHYGSANYRAMVWAARRILTGRELGEP